MSSGSASTCPFHDRTPASGAAPWEGRPAQAAQTITPPRRSALVDEATEFLEQFHRENGRPRGELAARTDAVKSAIGATGTYEHTGDELVFGARVAWRNNARCVGRLTWASLDVIDLRRGEGAEHIFRGCREHIRFATNGGRIRPAITIFAPLAPGKPRSRIWNSQLIRYAAYRDPDGSIVGDPPQAFLTEVAERLGWRPPEPRGPFDVLPLVIQDGGREPRVFSLPKEDVLEVELTHPEYERFAELKARWHALPVISDMSLVIGGIEYPVAPFSGWYVSHEIGARNLSDEDRYDMLPRIADLLGFDRRHDRTLWKDRALVELMRAVVHSFAAAKVKMVDHHGATEQFMAHRRREAEAGRDTPAEWSWIVPALSGSTCSVFHTAFQNETRMPNFLPQASLDALARDAGLDKK